ncbi:GNAT family acetyltransferase [Lutibaculum baratangense]|uniref:GCN5-related N-acetyltransferase n=1 Tax=Lutibaculum baratangense AMV1 TaxID=631454 RepID=V4TIM6_9HYPH|nr:GNAT family acetyltransferase [Lutibaculum baratangense]ESR25838.1 GCN5-related N-acetyltransferase [Lutibaculum baratangense AMV1]
MRTRAPTSGLAIREAEDGDAGAVIALWHAAGVSRPWNDPVRDFAFARRDGHACVLVGGIEGRPVATAMVGEDGHRGWVYYVAVEPALQGHGHGAAIMAAAEAWLAARGVWKVQLLVREDNAPVVAFYETLGYRDTRTVCLQKIIEALD